MIRPGALLRRKKPGRGQFIQSSDSRSAIVTFESTETGEVSGEHAKSEVGNVALWSNAEKP
jgi:hypothetical protein